jgi:hypothetical protein
MCQLVNFDECYIVLDKSRQYEHSLACSWQVDAIIARKCWLGPPLITWQKDGELQLMKGMEHLCFFI